MVALVPGTWLIALTPSASADANVNPSFYGGYVRTEWELDAGEGGTRALHTGGEYKIAKRQTI